MNKKNKLCVGLLCWLSVVFFLFPSCSEEPCKGDECPTEWIDTLKEKLELPGDASFESVKLEAYIEHFPEVAKEGCKNGEKRPCYGGVKGTAGVGACKEGTSVCANGRWSSCVGAVVPTEERCDGIDNDCDGRVDEDGKQACFSGNDQQKGVGPCKGGFYRCVSGKIDTSLCLGEVAPSQEVCDGLDNDCDGTVDEETGEDCFSGDRKQKGVGPCKGGTYRCVGGKIDKSLCLGEVKPTKESCDGKDNDCDGQTDEDLTQECGSDVGECKKGKKTCTSSKWGTCTGEVASVGEICNGKDDDCDGKTDEDFSKKGTSCEVGQGACKSVGKYICSKDMSDVACNAKAKQGSSEVCDGKDNDCDGKTDEDLTQECGSDVGECKKGKKTCTSGKWGTCTGEVKPTTETCGSGKDSNCDGKVSACEWIRSFGGVGYETPYALVADEKGNVTVTGTYSKPITVGATTLTSKGSGDVFIFRTDEAGKPIWVRSIGGTSNERGKVITHDGQENVIIAGFFASATFQAGAKMFTGTGGSDPFASKVDKKGNVVWARSYGDDQMEDVNKIATDKDGNIYIAGLFFNNSTFGTTKLTGKGNADIFVLKLDKHGLVKWVRAIGSKDRDDVYGFDIDSSGHIYVMTAFKSPLTVGTKQISSKGKRDIAIIKYDDQGTVKDTFIIGDSSDNAANALSIDPSGNIIIAGYFKERTKIGSTSLKTKGEYDVYMAKLTSSGKVTWVKSFGGSGNDFGQTMQVDKSGNIYLAGEFYNTMTVGSTTLKSSALKDIFVVKLNSSGSFLWGKSVAGSQEERPYAMSIGKNGGLFITGTHTGTMTHNNITVKNQGGQDMFLLYLNP